MIYLLLMCIVLGLLLGSWSFVLDASEEDWTIKNYIICIMATTLFMIIILGASSLLVFLASRAVESFN